jgi:hypothetical protein
VLNLGGRDEDGMEVGMMPVVAGDGQEARGARFGSGGASACATALRESRSVIMNWGTTDQGSPARLGARRAARAEGRTAEVSPLSGGGLQKTKGRGRQPEIANAF